MEPEAIEDHQGWCELLDQIEAYGSWPKEKLVRSLHDESGEGETLKELRQKQRGTLLALVIDSLYGAHNQ